MMCTLCGSGRHTAPRCILYRKLWAPLAMAMAALLTGCATTMPPVDPPCARLMTPPEPAGQVKRGDDLIVEHLKLRRQYFRETARLRSLQGYVKTVRGEK